MSSSDGNTRDRNDPKPRLASPYHTTNVSGLVLGCIEAILRINTHVARFKISKIYT